MARVKRGNVLRKRHKKILERAKGFRGGSSKLFRPAKQSVTHAKVYAYADRKRKKAQWRGLWITRISAALQEHNLSYSVFIGILHKQKILINRKVLAELAVANPTVFNQIVIQTAQG